MGTPFEQLIHVLEQELCLHGRLGELLAEERAAMRNLKADQLLAAAKEKDGLALQLKALEESRHLVIRAIARQRGCDDEDLALLSDVAAVAPPREATELARLGQGLRELAESSKSANDDNRFLANRSLESLQEAIQFLAKPAEIHKTYKRKGPLAAYRIAPQVMAKNA